ncbi:hypothetical protein GY45DRAFT_1376364 [Cubamyces sp. BRFM 1775]|nr:hypothetical protein GY45DRAFT_1376364 [Cubamyces sp. BRFM 1775]
MSRMIIVDPMHNLFLGLVKSHFYHIWVQLRIFRKSRELCRLHEILSELSLPSKLGRLPRLIGEPAGGSLTADQWLILATIVGPLIARIGSGAVRRSGRTRKPSEKAKELVLEPDDAGAQLEPGDEEWFEEDEEDDSSVPSQLHPRDLANFFKLCKALRLFLSDSLSEAQLTAADELIRQYCLELVELYGEDVIRPNHHYATHTADFVRDYGPLRGFWTFLFERLNKILKSFDTNNHDGGAIEVTFFREFYCAARLHQLLAEGSQHPMATAVHMACREMQNATTDHRGTLQQLVNELEEAYCDASGTTSVGLIQHVLLYEVPSVGVRELFAHVQWLRPCEDVSPGLNGTPWSSVDSTFCLQLWEADTYLEPGVEPSPVPIVSLSDILSPVVRHPILLHGKPRWITMPTARNPIVSTL